MNNEAEIFAALVVELYDSSDDLDIGFSDEADVGDE
jgi:hypothetical protein